MAQIINPSYSCTQGTLYSVCFTIGDSYKLNLPRFSAYKTKYDLPFFDAMKLKITNAKNLPDADARDESAEFLHIATIGKGEKVISEFLMLKGYITDSFPAIDLQ